MTSLKEDDVTSRQEFDELMNWANHLKEDFTKLQEISDEYDEVENKEVKKRLLNEFTDFLEDTENLEQRIDKIRDRLKKIIESMKKKLN